MNKVNEFSNITSETFVECANKFGTPTYLYDEAMIIERCRQLLAMPNAYGLNVRYAMKANSTKAILRTISEQGLKIDASSVNEAKRAHLAGIACKDIILTTQEVPMGEERLDLEKMMLDGMIYNTCSLRQLTLIGDFAAENNIPISMRVHPGVGTGETASRNTGDNYSCFGIHLLDIEEAVRYASMKGIKIDHVHEHIGSGGDPVKWQENIDIQLGILEKYFPDATTISFGGGLKDARVPGEDAADVKALGDYAKKRIEEFFEKTGRKLTVEIEPGTYVVANSGYIITEVMDKKSTGGEGMEFLIVNGGMELNARPLLYGSQHPFYVISKNGELLSSEFYPDKGIKMYEAVVVGRCCESGDSQSLDKEGTNIPRLIGEPEIGDLIVIGGAGAYCSAMSLYNYNSHYQATEIMVSEDGSLKEIRKRQTMAQILENEL